MLKFALFIVLGLAFSVNAKPAERIIALAPHIVENLYVIGAGERIVGTVAYADYPESAKQLPQVGDYQGISVEKILALKPDLIIAWKNASHVPMLEKLESFGVDVIYSEAKYLDKLPEELLRLGKITGLGAQAQQQADLFAKRLNELKDQYKQSASLAVFYQLWPSPLMTVGGESWLQQVFTVCNVKNVFADATTDYPQISIENVLLKSPQVIVIPEEKTKQEVKAIAWQQWPSIPAVKYQQTISVDADLLHRYSYRMLEGISDLCGKLDVSRSHYNMMKKGEA
ncbi:MULTISPECIES: cobalamin-binding protein [unclassified Pseudoalteromonas]|uniref:cobalamin-binding protein n=1 Tax=unclassified Pseudoalteromonas TaxID=194690 RepID=UPI000FFEC441|nr:MULTISPECIES: cobalamin-binding protein [unclassified Pseudoalteromonas]MCG9758513.1 cobalamin-binding protein [Pseudoalteromonas sp. Isolate6]RXE84211.1 cobalamin-binding protein [Pseudoalteromonas sp. A757]